MRLDEIQSSGPIGDQEYVLFIDGKPVSTYRTENAAEQDRFLMSTKFPQRKYEIKRQECKLIPVREGLDNCAHGKYYCSTDKVWKCRKGPKQSRS